ncbi:unnamed protein product [Absidia cylindrospora]
MTRKRPPWTSDDAIPPAKHLPKQIQSSLNYHLPTLPTLLSTPDKQDWVQSYWIMVSSLPPYRCYRSSLCRRIIGIVVLKITGTSIWFFFYSSRWTSSYLLQQERPLVQPH